jgi:hypothetical protein
MATTTGCELIEATDADAGSFQSYYYVLISDLEESEANQYGTNGCEIDGVELTVGGVTNYADVVDFISFGEGDTSFQDGSQVLGMPEGTCEVEDGNFVSLGGSGGVGGHVIVSFLTSEDELQEIVNGATVRVHECGDAPESYNTYVGVGTSVTDPHWHPCGAQMSGVAECIVTDLPPIPLD